LIYEDFLVFKTCFYCFFIDLFPFNYLAHICLNF
jgi:hypothetical protein